MKIKQSLLFVSMLLILVIAAGACIENTDESSDDPSDSFVHPGVGFEQVRKADELFLDAYGVIPEFKSEEERQEFSDKLDKVHHSIGKDIYENENEIRSHIGEGTPFTANAIQKAANENDIDISDSIIKYSGEFIVSEYSADDYIMVGWNVYRNYEYDPETTTLDEILKYENLTHSELIENSINHKIMDEVYEVYYQRGKELGIEDIPIVFALDGPVISFADIHDDQIDTESSVSKNEEVTSNKASSIGFTSMIFVLALAFIVSRKR